MTEDDLTDLVHHWRQVLSAMEDVVREGLGDPQSRTDEWQRHLRSNSEPLHEVVETARLNPTVDKAATLDLIAQLAVEVELLHNDLDNLASNTLRGESSSDRTIIDLVSLLEEVVALFEFRARKKGVEMVLEVKSEIKTRVNARLFRRALVNVIDNAVKYSFQRVPGTRRTVDVKAWRHSADGEIRIVVKSYGVPIAPDELELVFERSYRSPHARDKHRTGSGLGLPETRRIITGFSGRVFLESRPQEGGASLTVVTITLPAISNER